MAEGGRNLTIKPFSVDEDHIATGEKWDEWLDELEREMRFFRISHAEDMKDAMLIYGGVEIRRLEKSLQDPKDGSVYAKLKSKLNNYFSPQKNVHYARYLFLKTKQLTGESTVSNAARLREKALKCDFHDCDERILEHIIQTTTNSELVRQVLHKQWTLQQTLAEMQLLENTSEQVKPIGQHETQDVAKINRRKSKNKVPQNEQKKDQNIRCKYCDRTHPRQKELCPAYGKFCSKCDKRNHFSKVCMSVKEESKNLQKGNRTRRPRYGRDVKRTINDSDTDNSDSDLDQDSDFIDESVRHLTIGKIKVSKVSDLEKTVPIVVNDVIVHVEPDSGADVNVMDERQYGALKRKTLDEITLKTSNTKLSTLQNELKVSGEFKATVRNKIRGTETTFVVVKGKINSPPLLGKKTLSELGMLEIRPDGSLRDQNELRIRYENNVKSVLDARERSNLEKYYSGMMMSSKE